MIRIEDDILHLKQLGLLDGLLYDRTTKHNIIWATDAHASLGSAFARDKEIHVDLITGDYSGVIRTRAAKAFGQQSDRTRQHGEVFTPLRICKKMNDYADEMWFGHPDVFEKDGKPTGRVEFPKKRKWTQYVDSRRMEITCGEAPYLASRYDVATGEEIPIKERIGILDRKMRVVNENTDSEEEWLKWAFRALEATYGYEFQGDNLLIARINILMTFEEYLKSRWDREPTEAEYARLLKTATWNIWQMDGLTGTIPYAKAQEENHQYSIFELFEGLNAPAATSDQPNCRIFDWRAKESVEYKALSETKR